MTSGVSSNDKLEARIVNGPPELDILYSLCRDQQVVFSLLVEGGIEKIPVQVLGLKREFTYGSPWTIECKIIGHTWESFTGIYDPQTRTGPAEILGY